MDRIFELWPFEHEPASRPGLDRRLCLVYEAPYNEKAVLSLWWEYRFSDFYSRKNISFWYLLVSRKN